MSSTRFACVSDVVDWLFELEDHTPDDETLDAAFELVFGRQPIDADGDTQTRLDAVCKEVL